MPWSFYDNKGNLKQAAANAIRPVARMTQVNAQSVTNGVQTLLTFSGTVAADFDTYASVSPMWASGNPGRLTAPITGRYRVHASVAYVNTGANFTAGIELRKNGATALSGTTNGWTSESDGNSNAMDATVELALNAGDYIEILSYQQGGAARNTIPAGTFLTMEYLDGAVTVPVAYPQSLVGQEMAYAEFTGSTTAAATTEGTANTVVTAPSFTADGTSSYIIEAYVPTASTGGGGASLTAVLYEDGSSIGQLGSITNGAAGAVTVPARFFRKRTPASGSRTYSLRVFSSGGSGAFGGGAGGSGALVPGFIRITKAS